ncbi:MAG: AAA family ATPase [Planctomycetia bacterium]|nr:AAA family ATPase [Planctomycetia bacterium]
MDFSEKILPGWLVEMDKQLRRGKHVLLYGNVEDRFLIDQNGSFGTVGLTEALGFYLEQSGYAFVSHYDLVDGLHVPNPEQEDLFNQMIRKSANPSRGSCSGSSDPRTSDPRTSGPQTAGSQTAESRDTSHRDAFPSSSSPSSDPAAQDAASERRTPSIRNRMERGSDGNGGRSNLKLPNVALPHIRSFLSQTEIPSAAIIEYSDKLFSDAQRQEQAEREFLIQLKKIVKEAADLQENMEGRRNALIITASQLAAIPSWFYQEHPLLALIRIPFPDVKERRSFIEGFFDCFADPFITDDSCKKEMIDTFVQQTDGLTILDLMALGTTCSSEKIKIAQPADMKNVIAYYRYGEKIDPWEKFNADTIRSAPQQIQKRVIGQKNAVDAVVDMLITATIGITMLRSTRGTGKPKGVFFFVGPTGVGKTELAKALAELIFGDENRMRRFDMSEYAEKHAAEKLTGAPPGYVGYEEGGQLTNFVRENPFSLILFDEIEKAHGLIMDKFLQILEDGRLTDSKGQTAYFSQSVIIFTSNIGSDSLPVQAGDKITDSSPSYEDIQEHFRSKVRDHFLFELKRPEIHNRFGDNILVFDLLRPIHVRGICEKFLRSFQISAKEKRELTLVFEEPGIREMIEKEMCVGEKLKYGGRRIRTLLEEKIEKPFNRWIFENDPPANSTLSLGINAENELAVAIKGQ